MKNGFKYGIALLVFGVIVLSMNIAGALFILLSMVLMGTEVVPMLKKKSAQKPKKNAQNTANQNSTQIGVGRLSVVEGLIAAMIASVVGIGVVIPVVSKVSNETLNSTSVNPMLVQ
jgi:uncharacterized membrane protein YcjF (UPF0283 family)